MATPHLNVKCPNDSDVTIQTAEYDGMGRRMKKVVDNSGVLDSPRTLRVPLRRVKEDGTVVYFYDGWKICDP